MRPRDYLPLVLLGGIAAFVVVQGVKMRRDMPPRPRAAPVEAASPPVTPRVGGTTSATDTARLAGEVHASASNLVDANSGAAKAPPRDLAAIQELITQGSPGTYLLDIIAEQNNVLMRWAERRTDALRVWIDRYPGLPDFDPGYPAMAEKAFEEWTEAGFPMRFDIVSDSLQAEIRIRWAMTLPASDQERIGSTLKSYDDNGWVKGADITITTHDRESGKPFPAAYVAGIARHEVGHALGLGHSKNKADVMFPESLTTTISRADRATLHLLYILPPGPVK